MARRRWEVGLQVSGLLLLMIGGVWSGENDEQCASVFKEGSTDGVLSRVKSTLFTMGYAGVDALSPEDNDTLCAVLSAKMINKAGKEVEANALSAQAAVRYNGVKLAERSQCPMLGFCADIQDASSTDAWPITTLTWIIVPLQSNHAEHDCGKIKLLQEYVTWILLDDVARTVSKDHGFGSIPVLLAVEFLKLVHKMKCSGAGEPEFVKDRAESAAELEGAGSSLQGHLQSELSNAFFLQFGKSVNYIATSSGDGQSQLSAGHVDFAGSDAILATDLPGLASRQFRMIPIFAAAVAIVYNPHRLGDKLVLTREEVVSIFMGQRGAWPVQATTATAPAGLPEQDTAATGPPDLATQDTTGTAQAVLRVVRGDRSGTTQSFTKALYFFSGVGEGLTTPDYSLHPLQGSSLPEWPSAQIPYPSTTVCAVLDCSNTLCDAGYWLDDNTDACLKCPKDTYMEKEEHQLTQCHHCKPGTYALEPGSTECLPCLKLFSLELQGKCVSSALFFSALLIPGVIVLTLCFYMIHRRTMNRRQELLLYIKQEELIFSDPPHILGSGMCGMVLRAEYRGTMVAVKRVIPKPFSRDAPQSSSGSGGMDSEQRRIAPIRKSKRGISMVFDQASLSGVGTPLSHSTPGVKGSRQQSIQIIAGADMCFLDGSPESGKKLAGVGVHCLSNSPSDAPSPSPAISSLAHWVADSGPANGTNGGGAHAHPRANGNPRQPAERAGLQLEVLQAMPMLEVEEADDEAARRLDQNRAAWARTTSPADNRGAAAAPNGAAEHTPPGTPGTPMGNEELKRAGRRVSLLGLDAEDGSNHNNSSARSRSNRLNGDPDYDSNSTSSKSFFLLSGKSAKSLKRRRKDFRKEIQILSRLRHPCIVTVMGAVLTRQQEPLLVMECMELGSLHDLLLNESFFLEGDLLLPMLRDVAQGMRFLHAAAESVIHGDLKAGNVLVDSNFRAKVADFGLSWKRRTGVKVGTPAFMAPELLRGETGPTKEGDVYAFGILLYEAFAREEPYKGQDWATLKEAIAYDSPDAPLKRPPVPQGCPAIVSGLMQECWHGEAESRPTFEEIDRRIRALDIGCVTSQALEAAKKHQIRGSSVETVLFDMFPSHVAEALMQGNKVPPEQKEMVTVYFSDVVGFTNISSTITSAKVSDMLDRLYSKFDELALKHKIYKIETIGDAYIAVTNLFSDMHSTHAICMARFAVEVQEAASTTLIDEDDPSKGHIQIRVGLHSGPVVASVIGNKNPKYTLLGDTMNTASRMESNSSPGRVQCTKECAEHIRAQDEPSPTVRVLRRGTIHIKGKGNLETFWVQNLNDIIRTSSARTQDSPRRLPSATAARVDPVMEIAIAKSEAPIIAPSAPRSTPLPPTRLLSFSNIGALAKARLTDSDKKISPNLISTISDKRINPSK